MSATAVTRRTTCTRDCPDACSLLLTVQADGRPSLLRGDPGDPVTGGFLCERTSRFLARQQDPARLTTPLLRRARGAPLLPVSWDEALAVAAERLRTIRAESGPAAILHYRSGGSLGILKIVPDFLFERFGPVSVKRGDICSGAGEAAQEADFGVCESSDLHDLRHARTIVLWGKNVHTSNVHLLPVLRQARAAGASIIGLDPVRTRAAELCDVFLQPRPGADYALAMGLARAILDAGREHPQWRTWSENADGYLALVRARDVAGWAAEADVAAADLLRIAELYARPFDGGTRAASAILLGWGLGRRRNGGTSTRAIDALAVLAGHLGVPGGGVSYYYRRRAPFDLSFVGGLAAAPRSFAEARLGHEILEARDPPVRAVWITAGNPVAMLPDSGSLRAALAHSEFNVVVDTHPTDTTDCADLVLPTLTLLEDSDVLGAYGNHWLRVSEPALPAPGARVNGATNGNGATSGNGSGAGHGVRAMGALGTGDLGAARIEPDADSPGPRHEVHILQQLAARLDPELGRAMAGSLDDWKRRVMGRLERAGVTLDTLRAGPVRNPFVSDVLFEGRRFATPSGKARLLMEAALPAVQPGADYPLTLLACSTPKAQSSQWSVTLPPGPGEVLVHPESAAGLPDGARARLESRVGALEVVVKHDAAQRRDVVWLPKGGGFSAGRCANALVAAVESDMGGGAAYYDECVRLRPVSAPAAAAR
jgi:anaerobic selenocysteine-containing dehydrogenase